MSKTFTVSLNESEFESLMQLVSKTGGTRNGTVRLALNYLLSSPSIEQRMRVQSSGAGVSQAPRSPSATEAPSSTNPTTAPASEQCPHPKSERQIRPYGSWCGVCKTRLA